MYRITKFQFLSILSVLSLTAACSPQPHFTPANTLNQSLLQQGDAVASPEDFQVDVEADRDPASPENGNPNPPAPPPPPGGNVEPGMDPVPTPTPPGGNVNPGTDPVPTPTSPMPPPPPPGGNVNPGADPVPTPTPPGGNVNPRPDPVPSVTPKPTATPAEDPFADLDLEKPVPCSASGCAINIPTSNFCSTRDTTVARTNLLQSSGAVLKLYSVTYDPNANHSRFKHEISAKFQEVNLSQPDAAQLRQQLIDQKKMTLDLRNHPPGLYNLVLCSSDDTSEKCSLKNAKRVHTQTRPAALPFMLGDLKDTFLIRKTANGKVSVSGRHFEVLYKDNPAGSTSMGGGGCDMSISPLIVDTQSPLHSAGVQLSAPSKGIRFDMEGKGVKRQISWLTDPAKDCFLALPAADGKIHNIQELFGNNTVGPDGKKSRNGFEALKKHDRNRDLIIDAQDSVYSKLRLWCDAQKADGIVQAGELFTLEQKSLRSINLRYYDPRRADEDIYGNQARQRSTVLYDHGERVIFDIWFRPID